MQRAAIRAALSYRRIAPAAVCVMLLAACGSALGQTAADFQLLANRFAADLKARDNAKLRNWYTSKPFFVANLITEKVDSSPLQDREAVLNYWSRLKISAIKIDIQEALAAPGAGKGFWTEESKFEITVDENPPRLILGQRDVIWQPNGGSWQISEEFWSDMKYCTKQADGKTLSCSR
jgi:hypothetical protein